jgi:hypothetical protein
MSYAQESDATADAQLVQHYLAWKPPKGEADASNPYHDAIVAKGEEIVPALLSVNDESSNRVAVIWILGEIGSKKAFPFLLSEYIVRPSPRVAISLGSSLGEAELDYLFVSHILDERRLRQLLSNIYGEDWTPISGRNLPSLAKHTRTRLTQIKESCKVRSRPISG